MERLDVCQPHVNELSVTRFPFGIECGIIRPKAGYVGRRSAFFANQLF